MPQSDIFNILKKNITDILVGVEPNRISLEARLVDLGANSIDRMEITVSTMEDMDVKIPITEMGKVSNIGGLVELLYRFQNS